MSKYNHRQIEKKWQSLWLKKKVFLAKDFAKRPKKYILVEFPYPSGEGLHMGHLRPYVAADVYTRYHRMKGNEVMFPMGWDAFGLPAENYAIKMGVQPSITTKKNISNAKKQMLSWGLSFDWSREVNTTDPNYYKWTQWLFLQFYKKGLAYEATGLINWCPKDKTGLANEEVIDGKCERCGTTVEKKELRQWYLKITAYAEKLLEGLKNLPEWPQAVKLQQENWIGKKMGINISYEIESVGAGLGRPLSESGRASAAPRKPNYLILHGRNGSPESHLFPWLKLELENRGYEVQSPALPNTEEPDDNEQTEFVLKNCQVNANTVIVGHSFGGVVALRLLERGKKVKKLVLVSTPFSGKFLDNKARPSVARACKKGFDFAKIKSNASQISLLFDTSDYVVPMSDGEAFAKNLGVLLNKAKGQEPHFSAEVEPEVLSAVVSMVTCFTTRPDTNFGATFVVLGPEHPLLSDRNILNIDQAVWKQIEDYKLKSATAADEDRTSENRKKTGMFTGRYVINGLNNYRMPVYVADYVLGNVGTGAVVGVPGHDKRDFEFAQVFKLPVVRVVQKNAEDVGPIDNLDKVQEEQGIMVNSEFLNGLDIHTATEKIMDYMEEKGYGKRVVNYKLRDWVFSRQRYWGEPIPIIHCATCGIVPVPEKDLPVKLPSVKKYEPTGTGESPLAAINKWVNVKCPNCKSSAKRETNTMPQWAGSSWYWLRYTDPKNKKEFASISKQKYWTPVDVYFGGMEHTTLHLLYSRFWNLFLYDEGLVSSKEPYTKRKPHGIILAADGEKMSKSRGNVVNPDDIVKLYGADIMRMFELFLGPHEETTSWSDKGVVGVKRFLDRVWNWINKHPSLALPLKGREKYQTSQYVPPPAGVPRLSLGENGVAGGGRSGGGDSEMTLRALNKLIKKISEDIQNFRFNTAISAFMEFHNEVKDESISIESIRTFLKLLYPFAPHISEELNQQISKSANQQISTLQTQEWPEYDPKKIVDQTVEIVVQVNGKFKGKITVPSGSNQNTVNDLGTNLKAVKILLKGHKIQRVVFVKDRLINLVV